jgi:endonuclease I
MIRSAVLAISVALTSIVFTTNAFGNSSNNWQLASTSDPFGCKGAADAKAVNACNISALSKLARSAHITLGYNRARLEMFQRVDAELDSAGRKIVRCVYSERVLNVTTEGIPTSEFNTEHSWPQSYLKKYPGFESSRSDLYHLYPTEMAINGTRGNEPFTECPGEPNGNQGRVSEQCGSGFEPPEDHKGELARSMFYMSVTYNMPIDPR